MSSLPHCFFHSDVPHSHLWSLLFLNTISIMMSLLMVCVRCCITQMVQMVRTLPNPSLCLEAQPWLMFISDAISSLPIFFLLSRIRWSICSLTHVGDCGWSRRTHNLRTVNNFVHTSYTHSHDRSSRPLGALPMTLLLILLACRLKSLN
jgi:hypothetical protein